MLFRSAGDTRGSATGRGATCTGMDSERLSTGLLLLRGVINFGKLETRAGIREGGHRNLEDLSLKLELVTETVDELESQIAVIDRPTDHGQIVSDALQFAGVGGDVEIAAWSRAESLAEKEIPGGLVVDEEAQELGPGGAGAAASSIHCTSCWCMVDGTH